MAAQQQDLIGQLYGIDEGADWPFQLNVKTTGWVFSIGGSPAGGTFTVGWMNSLPARTVAVAYNASAATFQQALAGLGGIGAAGIKSVTGAAGGPWTVLLSDELVALSGNPTPLVDSSGLVAFGGSISVVEQPLDLTGYTAKMQIRDKAGGTIYQTLTSGSGITLGGSAGTVLIQMTGAQTALFTPWLLAQYDLFLISGSGSITATIYGAIGNRLQITAPVP